MKLPYPKTISEAKTALNTLAPDWRKAVNVETLSMANIKTCIIGQVFGNYWENIFKLFNDVPGYYYQDTIFGHNADKQAWIDAVNEPQTRKVRVRCNIERIRNAHKDNGAMSIRDCFLARALKALVKPGVRVEVGSARDFQVGDTDYNAGDKVQRKYLNAFSRDASRHKAFTFTLELPVSVLK